MKLNKRTYLIIFSILLISFTGCKDQKAEQKKLQSEVMEVHDVLMGEMDLIMKNKTELSNLQLHLDSLKKLDPTLDTVDFKIQIENLKKQLVSSDDAMMQWMNNFNPDYTGKSHEEILSYLNNQKIKIDSVKTLFKESLSKSNTLLVKYK
jgi:hypothetical protein